MSIWIDRKFLLFASNRLINFKEKKNNVYNFRCPFCGDSAKNKLKSRGYIYQKNNSLFYKCQNCGIGKNIYTFLSYLDPQLAKEYSFEVFKENSTSSFKTSKNKFEYVSKLPEFETENINNGSISLPPISSLPEENIAKKYVLERKIPKGMHKDLFYAEDFKKFVKTFNPEYEKDLFENDPRLIIPFRDYEKNVFAIQGRSVNNNKIRYITIKLNNDLKLFGLDRVDLSKKIYVTEGPIDSLFLNNAVATADSNLSIAEILGKDKLVLVYDNEPRNPQIVKQIEKSIEKGFKVCLFPEKFKQKDINDAILNGFSKPEITRMIDCNTYEGIRAKLEFNNWRKV